MTIVTPVDLGEYFGQVIGDDELDRAHLLCELTDASIAEVFGGVMPDPAPAGFKAVALTVIGRVWTNPRGLISETIGAYSYNLNRNLTGNGIELTPDERKRLRRAAGLASVTSVRLIKGLT